MEQNRKQDISIITAITALVFFLVLALFGRSVQASGLLKPRNGESSDVSLQSHGVRSIIHNGYAQTEADQVFVKSGDRDLEAIYTFPLPERSSLSEMSLWSNGEEVGGGSFGEEKDKKSI